MNLKTNPSHQIMLVDDDSFFQELVLDTLPDAQIQCFDSGEPLRQLDNLDQIDLILMDINLPNESGFDLCKIVRDLNTDVPILITSVLRDLESRILAYEVGANDYISKPFRPQELQIKCKVLIDAYRKQQHLNNQISHHTDLLLTAQKESANIQSINRFINNSHQCKDYDSLYTVFLYTLSELGLEGVLQIQSSSIICSSGVPSTLEIEIIAMSSHLSRIEQFGNNRAFYNWGKAKLLLRKVEGMVDTAAILMDSLETAITRIDTEKQLLQQLADLEQRSERCRKEIQLKVDDLSSAISQELVKLGLMSSLCEEEEQYLHDVVLVYKDDIDDQLAMLNRFNHEIITTVENMRRESREFNAFLNNLSTLEQTDQSVELF